MHMQHVIKEITETVDFLELTEDEFNAMNDLFYKVVSSKYPNLQRYHKIGDIEKCILTDNFTRIELIIKTIPSTHKQQMKQEEPPPPSTKQLIPNNTIQS